MEKVSKLPFYLRSCVLCLSPNVLPVLPGTSKLQPGGVVNLELSIYDYDHD
jgi:hypothetical protein